MNLTAPELMITGCFMPFLVLIVYGQIKLKRQAAELERNGGVEPPYAPVEPSAPGWLLRRFHVSERTQLRRMKNLPWTILGMFAWVLSFAMTGGLLPSAIAKIDLGQGVATNIWHSYLTQGLLASTPMCTIFTMMGAGLAMLELATAASGQFVRTRPLSRRFLYWSRVLPTLTAMIGGFVLAAALSWVLLLACYGPVYRYLDSDSLLAAASFHDNHLAHLGRLGEAWRTHLTSAPRLLLSLLTTMLMEFGFVVALLLQPIRMLRSKVVGGVLIWLGFIFFAILTPTINVISPRYARFFFLYNRLGPPPGYGHALVPVTVAIVFLVLASFFHERLET
jgi:hypothetical protein